MRCPNCGFENEEREVWCRACGKRMTVSFDQVSHSLDQKYKSQKAEQLEESMRGWLVLAAAFFLLMVTLKVLFGSGWPKVLAVPTCSETAGYAKVEYFYDAWKEGQIQRERAPVPD